MAGSRPQPRQPDYLGNPGPLEGDLLYLQSSHRSQAVWEYEMTVHNGQQPVNDFSIPLKTRRTLLDADEYEINNNRFEYWMRLAGFWHIYKVGRQKVDRALITSLVERWRPETNTFHMAEGEMTITLQDVAVILGLVIDGEAITGRADYDIVSYCNRFFGVIPPEGDISGNRLSLFWLKNEFPLTRLHNNDGVSDATMRRYVRATILRLIGGDIFSDKSERFVHSMFMQFVTDIRHTRRYSWGGACLGWLYRQLAMATDPTVTDIAGPLCLLQLWAWERFHSCQPIMKEGGLYVEGYPLGKRWIGKQDHRRSSSKNLTMYRHQFDVQTQDDILWQPYDQIIVILPQECTEGSEIWTSRVPLVCFHIVEWHYPDRVRRQFGWFQCIPQEPIPDYGVRTIPLRGNTDVEWNMRFHSELQLWNNRRAYTITSSSTDDNQHYHSQYGDWYRQRTRRFLTVVGATRARSVDAHEYTWISSQGQTSGQGFDVHRVSDAALGAFGERRRHINLPRQYWVADDVQLHGIDVSSFGDVQQRRRRHRTLQSIRTDVEVAPRRSCSAIPNPPTWCDYGGVERRDSSLLSQQSQPGTSSQLGPSQFPGAQYQLPAFYTTPGSYTGTTFWESGMPSSSNLSTPVHGEHTQSAMGFAAYSTPRAQMFSSFQSQGQFSGVLIGNQEGDISGEDVNADQEAHQTQVGQPVQRRRNPPRPRRQPGCGTH